MFAFHCFIVYIYFTLVKDQYCSGGSKGSRPLLLVKVKLAGADPGFHVGGAPALRGRQHTILPNFPKTWMKLRKILGRRGGLRGRPLRSATDWVKTNMVTAGNGTDFTF